MFKKFEILTDLVCEFDDSKAQLLTRRHDAT